MIGWTHHSSSCVACAMLDTSRRGLTPTCVSKLCNNPCPLLCPCPCLGEGLGRMAVPLVVPLVVLHPWLSVHRMLSPLLPHMLPMLPLTEVPHRLRSRRHASQYGRAQIRHHYLGNTMQVSCYRFLAARARRQPISRPASNTRHLARQLSAPSDGLLLASDSIG